MDIPEVDFSKVVEELTGVDVWSVNDAWAHKNLEDVAYSAIIELHPFEYLQQRAYYMNPEVADKHLEYLQSPHDFPIYMIDEYAECPSAVRYPIEDAINLIDGRDDKFASSFSYMMALAMLQERNPIHVWGFDMGSGTEWFYQRPNAEWWCGSADGRGFDVLVSPFTHITKTAKMYGYNGGQMIDRQVLEGQLRIYKEQLKEAQAAYERWQGILMERQRLRRPQAEINEAAIATNQIFGELKQCEGAITITQFYIDECDLIPVSVARFHPRTEDAREQMERMNHEEIQVIGNV